MKISIITSTYNSEKTLRDTIESVIRQDYPDIEYIIIDGGSTDHTLDIVKEYGEHISRVISEPDRGIYDAMNKGISLTTGDVVGLLNSDDFFASDDVVRTIAETMEADPTLDGVHANLYYVDPVDTNRVIRYWRTRPYPRKGFLVGWHPAHPTFYVRKSCYEELGGFRLDMPLSADFELMLRFIQCKHIRVKHINKVFVRMRVGGATSKNIMSIVRGIKQCRYAFKVNDMKAPLLYPVYRLFPKLGQFIFSAKSLLPSAIANKSGNKA